MNDMQRGFSLIEILVFTSIVSVFFVVALTVATYSLRLMKSNENKLRATRYAEELEDWMRGEKEVDWNTFTTHTGTFCFNNDLVSGVWPLSGACTDYSLDGFFKREVTLSLVGSQMSVNIVVYWPEGTGLVSSVPINTVLAQF